MVFTFPVDEPRDGADFAGQGDVADHERGVFGMREDVVFLINGIPVPGIKRKNFSKDEVIGLTWWRMGMGHNQDFAT